MLEYTRFKNFTVMYNTELKCFSVEAKETITHGFSTAASAIEYGLTNNKTS